MTSPCCCRITLYFQPDFKPYLLVLLKKQRPPLSTLWFPPNLSSLNQETLSTKDLRRRLFFQRFNGSQGSFRTIPHLAMSFRATYASPGPKSPAEVFSVAMQSRITSLVLPFPNSYLQELRQLFRPQHHPRSARSHLNKSLCCQL